MHDSSPSASRSAIRLQKVLASAGFGSRRTCEVLIDEGRVEVNGHVVTEQGVKVDPFRDTIRVDGETLRPPKRRRYYAVHKPVGVVCTHRDPQARRRVIDLVPGGERLFPVGRLDRSSSGLILLTNDGDFANALAHPRYGVEKTYRVRVAGHPSPRQLRKLERGVHLAEGVAKAESVRIKRRYSQSTELEIVLREGRNREIRRMLARVGHKVQQLRRVAIGNLRLEKELPPGAYRELTAEEVQKLLRSAQGDSRPKAQRRRSRKKPSSGRRESRSGTTKRPAATSKSPPTSVAPRRSGPVLNLVTDDDGR